MYAKVAQPTNHQSKRYSCNRPCLYVSVLSLERKKKQPLSPNFFSLQNCRFFTPYPPRGVTRRERNSRRKGLLRTILSLFCPFSSTRAFFFSRELELWVSDYCSHNCWIFCSVLQVLEHILTHTVRCYPPGGMEGGRITSFSCSVNFGWTSRHYFAESNVGFWVTPCSLPFFLSFASCCSVHSRFLQTSCEYFSFEPWQMTDIQKQIFR